MVSKKAANNEIIATREMTDTGFVQSYFTDGKAVATRTFKRVWINILFFKIYAAPNKSFAGIS